MSITLRTEMTPPCVLISTTSSVVKERGAPHNGDEHFFHDLATSRIYDMTIMNGMTLCFRQRNPAAEQRCHLRDAFRSAYPDNCDSSSPTAVETAAIVSLSMLTFTFLMM